jgi:hypothetical protein
MSDADIISYGQTKNPFQTIDPLEGNNKGADSYRMDLASAKGGSIAAVTGGNKVIMDTDWQKIPDDWLGTHQLFCKWFSSITSGTGIQVQYWKQFKWE